MKFSKRLARAGVTAAFGRRPARSFARSVGWSLLWSGVFRLVHAIAGALMLGRRK